MRKKIWERWLPAFAAVLAFALILLLPDTAFAKAGDKVDSGEEDGAIAWELVENSDGTDTDPRYTLKLTRKSNGMGYMKDYDNYTTGYRPAWDKYMSKTTQVEIGNGFSRIGAYAFAASGSSGALRKVTIGKFSANSSGTAQGSIREYAFANQPKLTELTIGENLYSIGDCAFRGAGIQKLMLVQHNLLFIGEGAFQNCKNLEVVAFTANNIMKDAFRNCSKLKTLTFGGDGNIMNNAFDGCSALSASGGRVYYVGSAEGWAKRQAERVYSGNDDLKNAAFYFEPGAVWLTSRYIPDAVLLSELKKSDKVRVNGVLDDFEIEDIVTLNLGAKKVADLTGLKYLDQLRYLYCYHTNVTKADMKGVRNLIVADFAECPLESLDVSENAYLEELYLEDTTGTLETVDITHNQALKKLHLYRGSVKTVDVRSNPRLLEAALYGDELKLTSYYTLYRSESGAEIALAASVPEKVVVARLSEEDFPCKAFLDEIKYEYRNTFDKDDWLSLTEARAVTSLFPEDGEEQMTSLKGIEFFVNLNYLSSFNCALEDLDLQYNVNLVYVDVNATGRKTLDVSKLEKLETLYCARNQLTSLNLQHNKKLTLLDCWENKIKSLDLSANTALTYLDVSDNQLASLNVGMLTALTHLNCSYNPVKTVDVSKNKALTELSVAATSVTKLNISANTKLTGLSVSGSGITALDLSRAPELQSLSCYKTGIGSLNLSACPKLLDAYAGTKEDYKDQYMNADYVCYTSREHSSWKLRVSPGQEIDSLPFADVPKTAPYYEALEWAYGNGIVKGTDKTHFSPNKGTTRGEFCTMLWRLNGSPALTEEMKANNPFTDIKPGKGHGTAVLWCADRGIITGYKAANGTRYFNPGGKITRTNMIVMMYKMAKNDYGAEAVKVSYSGSPYKDIKATNKNLVVYKWAYVKKISRPSNGMFEPSSNCLRWHLVFFLYRYNNVYHVK